MGEIRSQQVQGMNGYSFPSAINLGFCGTTAAFLERPAGLDGCLELGDELPPSDANSFQAVIRSARSLSTGRPVDGIEDQRFRSLPALEVLLAFGQHRGARLLKCDLGSGPTGGSFEMGMK